MRKAIQELQKQVILLGRHFDPPELVEQDGMRVWRHSNPNDLLMSWLKCIRSVSSLNAAVVLLDAGFVQEVGALCRCVDEFCQDVMFLAQALGEGGKPSEQQRKMVEEYFQEEFEASAGSMLTTKSRNRVPRGKVAAGIARIVGSPVNPHDAQKMHELLNNAFSGYVHGAYVHTMEMYGASSRGGSYHTHGLTGTPRIAEWADTLGNYVYRALIAAEMVAKRCGDTVVVAALSGIRTEYEARSGKGSGDPNKILRKAKSGSTKT